MIAAAAGAPGSAAAARAAAREVEHAAAFEEELALLRQEQVEARQVDLLLVDLDLREVGVDGEVGGEIRGDAVLHVAADVAVLVVRRRRIGQPIGASSCRARTA